MADDDDDAMVFSRVAGREDGGLEQDNFKRKDMMIWHRGSRARRLLFGTTEASTCSRGRFSPS